jgi:hypothetical protein
MLSIEYVFLLCEYPGLFSSYFLDILDRIPWFVVDVKRRGNDTPLLPFVECVRAHVQHIRYLLPRKKFFCCHTDKYIGGDFVSFTIPFFYPWNIEYPVKHSMDGGKYFLK